MPHNFIRISVDTPNPGRRRRRDVEAVCAKHNGSFEYLWFDHDSSPKYAYVLVEDGDVDGIARDLHGQQVITLFKAQD